MTRPSVSGGRDGFDSRPSFTVPWSNGHDARLSSERPGFDSRWDRHLVCASRAQIRPQVADNSGTGRVALTTSSPAVWEPHALCTAVIAVRFCGWAPLAKAIGSVAGSSTDGGPRRRKRGPLRTGYFKRPWSNGKTGGFHPPDTGSIPVGCSTLHAGRLLPQRSPDNPPGGSRADESDRSMATWLSSWTTLRYRLGQLAVPSGSEPGDPGSYPGPVATCKRAGIMGLRDAPPGRALYKYPGPLHGVLCVTGTCRFCIPCDEGSTPSDSTTSQGAPRWRAAGAPNLGDRDRNLGALPLNGV